MATYQFGTTRWSVVLAAGDSGTPGSAAASDELCRAYWPPLYAYVRRQGYSPSDAEDLTQGFFEWLVESRHLWGADPESGKFRSFLLARMKHFLCDDRKRVRAQKRGGDRTIVSLDAMIAEERLAAESLTAHDPDRGFDQQWALTLLERTARRLRSEYAEAGRADQFEELKCFQPGDTSVPSYAEAASNLGLSESAIKSAIWRLRQRYRELLRDEIAQTVATPGELDAEIRHLISVIGGSQ